MIKVLTGLPAYAELKLLYLGNFFTTFSAGTQDKISPGPHSRYTGFDVAGQIYPLGWTPPAEVADSEYPFVLSTGRRLYHYHTRTQTGRCQGLNDLLGEETADISMQDATAIGIEPDEKIRVKSRRGEVIVKARVTHEVPTGMVWMAFHFRETCANWLTNPAFDPISATAEYKACAVRIEKV